MIVDQLVRIEIGPEGITAENLSDNHVKLEYETVPNFQMEIVSLKPREKSKILPLSARVYDPAEDREGM